MRAIIIKQQGSPVANQIELGETADAAMPQLGEVRLRVLASAMNHMDLWVGRGVPGLKLQYPRTSGCDACGVVTDIGPGVDEAWLGKRVVFNAAVRTPERPRPFDPPASSLAPNYELIGEHRSPGAHAQMVTVPVANCADVGDADPAEAAAFGLVALTAWSMLITKARLACGQSVLITGIGGGVATASLAIAKHFGCPVCVTSRHEWKLEKARTLGADHAVLDTGNDFSADVRAWTNKRGVDICIDSVGKATHLSCIRSMARGGAYVTPGCTTGPDATTDLARIFWNQLRLLGSTMGGNDEFAEVVALFRSGAMRPEVDTVYTPEQCVEAYQRLEAGHQFGKIVFNWQ
jgi:NADPH:quinone reductase-like Zn-dependent oxidoreductase